MIKKFSEFWEEKGTLERFLERFIEYWKKGAKVWFMSLCINILLAILFLPIAWLFLFLFGRKYGKLYYYPFSLLILFIVGPPLMYYVFRAFYKETDKEAEKNKVNDGGSI